MISNTTVTDNGAKSVEKRNKKSKFRPHKFFESLTGDSASEKVFPECLRYLLLLLLFPLSTACLERLFFKMILVKMGLHNYHFIPRCYKDVYVNDFFPCTARLLNSLPVECFPLTYDLNGFKSRINRHMLTVGSFWRDSLYLL